MNATFKAVLFTIAFVCFVIAVFDGRPSDQPRHPFLRFNGWVAAGLASFVFPFVWDAWVAT